MANETKGGELWKSRREAGLSTTRVSGDSKSAASAHLTDEESIVLRALVAGQNQKQICKDLRMGPGAFHRLLRDLGEKTWSEKS
jgi:DNA-binding NarL/FixJ family response regulator